MKKLFSTIFATLLSLSLILTGFTFTVQADDLITETEKISCNATLDDNFADNRVLVVLTREASLEFNTYTANSFASLGCTKVTDLSTATGAMARTAMEQATAMLRSGESLNLAAPVEHSETISNYKQVLCLELNQSGKQNVLDTIKVLMQRDDVIYAGPDYVMTVWDTNEVNATSTEITEAQKRWAADAIDLIDAVSYAQDPAAVITVGVIDTGIDGDHPYLASAINTNLCRDFTSGTSVATGVPTDDGGHGTKVAGVIAARADIYAPAANSGAMLVSLKAFSGINGYSSHSAAAINFATSTGIDILNFSAGWDGDGLDHYDYALEAIICNYPGLFVCAAGNDGENNNNIANWPCNYRLPNLISVGASDQNDGRWVSNMASNYGDQTVDIFAPGVDIFTTLNGGACGLQSGTSLATPLVAGVAALILGEYPTLTPAQLRCTILGNVDSVSGLSDLCVSGGRLNAYEALTNIHIHTYTNTSDPMQHRCTCSTCGYTFLENHSWQQGSGFYRCTKCLVRVTSLPVEINNVLPTSPNNENSDIE